MKTNVYVLMNGAAMDYVFDIPLEKFIGQWNDHNAATDYYSGYDENGQFVVISPRNCGVIEISNKK